MDNLQVIMWTLNLVLFLMMLGYSLSTINSDEDSKSDLLLGLVLAGIFFTNQYVLFPF